MRKGGYQIINLKDTNFVLGTAQTVVGIYEALEGNYRKPVLLTGITVAGTEYPDAYTQPILDGTTFTMEAYGNTITVTQDNSITIQKKS